VHPVDAQAQLEAQVRFVAQPLGDLDEQIPAHVQGQLVAVDHDFLDGVLEFNVVAAQCLGQLVDHVVEVAAVGPGAAARENDLAHQPPVAGGVAGALDPEHAAAHINNFLAWAGHRLHRILVG
jgi:hypothetical protein